MSSCLVSPVKCVASQGMLPLQYSYTVAPPPWLPTCSVTCILRCHCLLTHSQIRVPSFLCGVLTSPTLLVSANCKFSAFGCVCVMFFKGTCPVRNFMDCLQSIRNLVSMGAVYRCNLESICIHTCMLQPNTVLWRWIMMYPRFSAC